MKANAMSAIRIEIDEPLAALLHRPTSRCRRRRGR